MHRRMSTIAAAATLGLLIVAAVAIPSLAGFPNADPTGNTAIAEFEYDNFFLIPEEDCQYEIDGEPLTETIGPDQDELDAVGFVPPDEEGIFSVSDLPGGRYWLTRSCDVDEKTVDQTVGFSFARVLVAKQVEGPLPDDAEFGVTITCTQDDESVFPEQDDVTRTFDGEGTEQAVFYEPDGESTSNIICTVEETETAGATSVGLEPEDGILTYDDLEDQTATITNTFPEPEVDDTVEEAPPAEPVEEEPDFTG